MPIDPKLLLNIDKSIATYFSAYMTSKSLPFLFEIAKISTQEVDCVGIRWDGPYIRVYTKNEKDLLYEINTLVQTVKKDTDLYAHTKMLADAQGAFEAIPIFDYDSVPDEFGVYTQIGCLVRAETVRGNDRLIISRFGQIDPNLQVQQSTIEASYKYSVT